MQVNGASGIRGEHMDGERCALLLKRSAKTAVVDYLRQAARERLSETEAGTAQRARWERAVRGLRAMRADAVGVAVDGSWVYFKCRASRCSTGFVWRGFRLGTANWSTSVRPPACMPGDVAQFYVSERRDRPHVRMRIVVGKARRAKHRGQEAARSPSGARQAGGGRPPMRRIHRPPSRQFGGGDSEAWSRAGWVRQRREAVR